MVVLDKGYLHFTVGVRHLTLSAVDGCVWSDNWKEEEGEGGGGGALRGEWL